MKSVGGDDNQGKEKGEAISSEVAFSFAVGSPLKNEKHELFCLEFLARGRNGVRAYQAVYAGTTYMSAAAAASRLLNDDKIQARIQELYEEQVARLKATADRVLMEAGKLAFINARDLFDGEGKMIPIHELDPEVAAAIVSIEYDEIYSGEGKNRKVIGRTAKVKLADKYKGIELLGKRLKVFSDKVEHTHKFSLEDLLAGSEGAGGEE